MSESIQPRAVAAAQAPMQQTGETEVPSLSTVYVKDPAEDRGEPIITQGAIERFIHYNASIKSAEYDEQYAATVEMPKVVESAGE